MRPVQLVPGGYVGRPLSDVALELEHRTGSERHVTGGDCRGEVRLSPAHDVHEG